MANGKGNLECGLCKYSDPHFPSWEKRMCQHHKQEISLASDPGGHMICCHFEPSEQYWKENHDWMPPARRFSWFGVDLEAGYLYEFSYPDPKSAKKVKDFGTHKS